MFGACCQQTHETFSANVLIIVFFWITYHSYIILPFLPNRTKLKQMLQQNNYPAKFINQTIKNRIHNRYNTEYTIQQ